MWVVGGDRRLHLDRTLVMGVLNVTPDSFSDGGAFAEHSAAIGHGFALHHAGADIIDVGGESTRPGAADVDAEVEASRVVPVVRRLAEEGLVVSVDTSKASVAREAIAAGAAIVNDVTGLRDDPMIDAVASSGAGVVIMHMQGTPRTMQERPRYDDVVTEVRDHLLEQAARAESRGIDRDRIAIDPGIGFGKTLDHNLALLARIDVLVATGYPVLVGASRKSFIGKITGQAEATDRDGPTIAVHTLAIGGGAHIIRVHDAELGRNSARVADAIVAARRGEDQQ